MPEKSLTDLPPELLDHITTYLSSANSLSNLSLTSKSLHKYVEKDAWQTFAKDRFPSLSPTSAESYKNVTRTLTSLSRAWDRRAFVARYTEPRGDITTYPGAEKTDRWKRPKGQTIGFTPFLDVYEDEGAGREVLANSAGAEVCIRTRDLGTGKGSERWSTYRPLTAYEGRDDVTSLHLLRPRQGDPQTGPRFITGTANGDLQMTVLPLDDRSEVQKTYFTTQGQAVRSSSLLQRDHESSLFAAAIGDTKICLYPLTPDQQKIAPTSEIDLKPDNSTTYNKSYRAWSTTLLSPKHLAVGLGPSEDPLHIYTLTPTGLSTDNVRKFSLQTSSDLDDRADEIAPGGVARKPISSVYPVSPLPHSSAAASNQENEVFLSGAYDGIIRLHDLRSNRDVVGMYADPTDDSAVYSLLPRGRETLIVGTSRHNLLKVFDLRLGAKCYSYLDAHGRSSPADASAGGWSLFLKPHTDPSAGRSSHPWGGGGGRNRQVESSVYTLASASASSPHVFAGISNNVIEMAFTDVIDSSPDLRYFCPWPPVLQDRGGVNGKQASNGRQKHPPREWNGWSIKEVLNLACIEQSVDVNLRKQRPLGDAGEVLAREGGVGDGEVGGLDWRWWGGRG